MYIVSHIPSRDSFLTEQYIAQLIETGKWSTHGESLDRFIDDKLACGDLPASLLGAGDVDDILIHPDFKTYLTDWLPRRFIYVVSLMKEEIASFPLQVNRTLWADNALIDQILADSGTPVGIYWGTGATEAWGAAPKPGMTEINVFASIGPEQIDWHETIRSRMDYSCGDDEGEICLNLTARPTITRLFRADTGEDFAIDTLPPGWTEATRGGMACNPDPDTGGIIDQEVISGEWFVVFNREELDTISGLGSRAEAFAKYASVMVVCADRTHRLATRDQQPGW